MGKQAHECRWVPMGEVLLETMNDIAFRQNDSSRRKTFLTDLKGGATGMKQCGIDIGEFDMQGLEDAIKAIEKGVI